MAGLIEDYGIIGDTQTAALVGRDGSIDWLCLPRFDSAACFAALLGEPRHGRWQLAPADQPREVRRRYRDDTLVLETEYTTGDGTVAVIDLMPPREHHPTVIRVVEGRGGAVRMQMEFVLRFDYGAVVPWVRSTSAGISCVAGADAVQLKSPVELQGRNLTTFGSFVVEEGDRLSFALTWYPSHEEPPPYVDCFAELERTETWWHAWSDRNRYDGEWAPDVLRSLITLKALTYAPSGGICAAATTSLPEDLGGVRNWDYRYCWLRDATFTLHCLLSNGFHEEALDWTAWLRRAVAGQPGDFQIMYGVEGERRLSEYEVDWLPGYESSAPVRVGNAASGQFQLDVFGEVMDVGDVARRALLPELPEELDSQEEIDFARGEAWDVQLALMEHLERVWTEPDDGIWEVRGPRRHFTHSKVMAWVAADRGVRAIEEFGREGPVERWRNLRDDIHREVCEKGYDPTLKAFTQYYGSDLLDASLLMIPMVGFLAPSDPRVVGTVEAIQRELTEDGLVRRYQTHDDANVDGLPGSEGTFLMTSFWLVDNLALIGRRAEAMELFERLRSLRNDLGLFAEEYDVTNSRLLGNFPQAFSHVAFVNSATNLSKLADEGGDVLPSREMATTRASDG